MEKIIIFGLVSFVIFVFGCFQVFLKNNPFGETHILFWLGVFVWGDAIVLGLFWTLVALICLFLNNWNLFLLIVAVFWVVRSLGEVFYWINQQFSPIIRNHPKNLLGYKWFKNDSIWFIYQIMWQCVLVVSIVATIYIARL